MVVCYICIRECVEVTESIKNIESMFMLFYLIYAERKLDIFSFQMQNKKGLTFPFFHGVAKIHIMILSRKRSQNSLNMRITILID